MLALTNITKSFDGVAALAGVGLELAPGRVHGVLGENGAGKTTLMRVAAGMCRPDAGEIRLDGRVLHLTSPQHARQAGISMVHQHFCLVPALTVAENCILGRREYGQYVSRRVVAGRLRMLSERIGLTVDPSARVESLSVGEQQRVEIVRALCDAGRVLILDEPTAVLTPQETDRLFEAMDRLRGQGLAIAFISHKLQEVRRICDDLTILRRGRCVYRGPAADLSTAQMAEHMVGEAVPELLNREGDAGDGPAVLELRGVEARDPGSHRRLAGVDLTVRPGEIVGVAGVEGNGQDVLAAVIVGVLAPLRGGVWLDGREVTGWSVRARTAAGLAHIAEDRLRQALVPAMTLRENLILKAYGSEAFGRYGWLHWGAVQRHATERLARFDVRPPAPLAEARSLSGGNQQKVVLARELGGRPRLVVAQNPARGLDVSATRFVFGQLLEQRRAGAGVLLIHSDLDELLALADRVVVMAGGRCLPTDWPACGRAEIGRLMLEGGHA